MKRIGRPYSKNQSASPATRIFIDLMEKDKRSTRELERKIGISRMAMWRWRNGQTSPSVINLEAALDVLGYRIDIVKKEKDNENATVSS